MEASAAAAAAEPARVTANGRAATRIASPAASTERCASARPAPEQRGIHDDARLAIAPQQNIRRCGPYHGPARQGEPVRGCREHAGPAAAALERERGPGDRQGGIASCPAIAA